MILLKVFSGPSGWGSSLSSIPMILRFAPFTLSQISWMAYVRNFLHLTFSLTNVFIYSIDSSLPEILSLSSSVLLVTLASVVPFQIPKVFLFRFPQFVFSLLLLFAVLGLEQFYWFPSTVAFSWDLFVFPNCLCLPGFLYGIYSFPLPGPLSSSSNWF